MDIPKDLFNLYSGLSGTQSLYIRARWRVSPISKIEKMLPTEGRIYDLGCGVGLLSNLLAVKSAGRKVTGVDMADDKIDVARRSVGERRNIRFEKGDALKTPLEEPSAVVACDLCHHMEFKDQEIFFKHVYGSLKNGGIFLIEEIDKKPFLKYIFALGVDKILGGMAKVYYRSSEELGIILRNVGYEVEVIRIDKGYPVAAVLFKCSKK